MAPLNQDGQDGPQANLGDDGHDRARVIGHRGVWVSNKWFAQFVNSIELSVWGGLWALQELHVQGRAVSRRRATGAPAGHSARARA
jgi:hypothetical protein